ncbi:MAG: hypothetical protein HYU77_14830 [Betaproteobacteria bacterium]|nr:hypothetical protein [Betaproteobacteria bacterium]
MSASPPSPHSRFLVFQAGVALAAFVSAIVLGARLAPQAVVHLVVAVGVMPLIFAAIMYFVPVLTRGVEASYPAAFLPWGVLAAGLFGFGAFVHAAAGPYLFATAAGLGFLAAFLLALWIAWRASHCLGAPHPCIWWYLAAALCLAVSLAGIFAMHEIPGQYLAIKRLHLHLNLLGFIGLTAVGTIQVLMPTVTGKADAGVAKRLMRQLLPAVAGTVVLAMGTAWYPALAWIGLLLWITPALFTLIIWLSLYRKEILAWSGAAPSLFGALAGFIVVLAAGAWNALGGLAGYSLIAMFFVGFLFPLVTGAVSHLLPVWLRPGIQTDWHRVVRRKLVRFGGLRAALFAAALIIVPFDLAAALGVALAGLATFVWNLALISVRGVGARH